MSHPITNHNRILKVSEEDKSVPRRDPSTGLCQVAGPNEVGLIVNVVNNKVRACCGLLPCVCIDADNFLPSTTCDKLFCPLTNHYFPHQHMTPRAQVLQSRFDGYSDSAATSKKLLTNVLKQGDCYFNSGDLLYRDGEGFYYWSDRVGDTFRWKGEVRACLCFVCKVMLFLYDAADGLCNYILSN